MRFIDTLPETEKQAFLNPSRKDAQPAKAADHVRTNSGSNNENVPMTPASKRPGRPPKDRSRVDDSISKVFLKSLEMRRN